MKKMKFSTITIRVMSMLAIASMFILAGCGDDDDGGTPAPTQNIWELAQSTPGLDSLAKYLAVYPDLVATLQSTGPFTVFAPDNQAFASLLETPGFPSDIRDIDPEIVKGVLAYHVVPGTFNSGDLNSGDQLTTAFQSEVIEVNADGTLKTGATNQNIVIKTADVAATNGVVHIVGSVLIPPSVGESLTPILGTLAGTVLLGADFTYLADLIEQADENVPDGEPSIVEILSTRTTLTAFVPPNPVFEGAASNAGVTVEQFIASLAGGTDRAVLLTHLTEDGNATSSSLNDQDTFTALSGVTLTITVEDPPANSPTGVLVEAPGNDAPIPVVVPDVNPGNGTIGHVIGGILLPQ